MSKSQFKIKGGRQRLRSAKPYERNKNLVNKVKSWLNPSSWLGYWSSSDACEDDPSGPDDARVDHSSSAGSHSRILQNSLSDSETTSHRNLSDNSLHPPITSALASSTICADRRKSLNSQSLSSSVGDKNMSNSTNESWVAESPNCNDEMLSQSSEELDSLTFNSSQESSTSILSVGDAQDMVSSVSVRALRPGSLGGQRSVQLTSNSAFSNQSKANISHKTFFKRKTTGNISKDMSVFSADFSQRLYSSPGAAISTPLLSPVYEGQVENRTVGAATISLQPMDSPFVSISQSSNRTFDTPGTRPLTAPSRTFTDESIRLSPFKSPFYSGRTSFGGVSSGQKIKLKRPRTESSLPVVVPLHVSVHARPAPLSPSTSAPQSMVTQTAKKIMDALNSISSPLSDARKLPMRDIHPEMQQAKRRRFLDSSASTNTVLSPPPVTPLHSQVAPPRFSPQTQIVPSEMSSRKQSSNVIDGGSSLQSLAATTTTQNLSTRLKFPVTSLTSVSPPKTSGMLSGLQFSAPPLVQPSVTLKPSDRETSNALLNERSPQTSPVFRPSMHSIGKMSRRSRGARSRHSFEEEEEDEYVNPVAPPPPVGLNLGQGCSLPSFTFHSQLLSEKKSTSPVSKAPSLSSPQSSSSVSSFSFSVPTPVDSSTAVSLSVPGPEALFSFSAPSVQVSNITTTTQSSSPVLFSSAQTFSSKKQASLSFATKFPSVPKSVQPFSVFKPPSTVGAFKQSQSAVCEVVDLTESEDGKESLSPEKQRLPDGLSKAQGKSSSAQVSLSGGFQLKPSSHENKTFGGTTSLATATLKPLRQFGPPADSWECDTCLISNKATDVKCVACSSAKPASKVSGGAILKPLRQFGPPADSWVSVQPFSVFKPPSTVGAFKQSQSAVCEVVDLTESEDGKESLSPEKQRLPDGLSKAQGKSSSAQVSLSGGFQLKPSSHENKTFGGTTSLATATLKPLRQFGPPADSWECDTCLISNKATDVKCVACSSAKPASKVSGGAILKPLRQFGPPADSWECDTCLISNKATDVKCIACSSAKPASKVSGGAILKPLRQFGPPADSWECDTCLVSNKATDVKCVACSSAKPASKISGGTSLKPLRQFGPPADSWECDTCLISNKATDVKCVACNSAKPASKVSGGAILKPLRQFGPPADSWKCDTCLVSNKATDIKCVACSSAKPASKAPTSATSLSTSGLTTGVSSNITSGLPFLEPLPSLVPSSLMWTCDTCLVENKLEVNKCVACTTPKPGEKTQKEDKGASTGLKVDATGGFKLGSGINITSFAPTFALGSSAESKMTANIGGGNTADGANKPTGLQLGGFTLAAGVSLGGVIGNNKLSIGNSVNSSPSNSSPASDNGLNSELKVNLSAVPSFQESGIKLTGFKPVGKLSTESTSSATSFNNVVTTNLAVSSNRSLIGVKFGENLKTDTLSTGLKLGGTFQTTPSSAPSIGLKFGSGFQTTTSGTSLTGLKVGSEIPSGTPLTGLGAGFQATASSSPLIGLKLGSGVLSTSNCSPLTVLESGTSSSALSTGIKSRSGEQTSSSGTPLMFGTGTKPPFNTNPLGGIKLSGTFPSPSLPITNFPSTATTTTKVGPGASSPFVFGQTSTSGPQNMTTLSSGMQKQGTNLFQFTGTASSVKPMTNSVGITPAATPSSSFGVGFNFGTKSTPFGSSSKEPTQVQMLGQDHDMNVEQEQSTHQQNPVFANNQLPALSSNMFRTQPQQPAVASFSFGSNPQTAPAGGMPFGGSLSNAGVNFSSDSANKYSLSTQKQNSDVSGIPGGSGLNMFKPPVPNSTSSGFNFSKSSQVNLNFVPIPQSVPSLSQNVFTAEPSSSTSGSRVIKKARRRKPNM